MALQLNLCSFSSFECDYFHHPTSQIFSFTTLMNLGKKKKKQRVEIKSVKSRAKSGKSRGDSRSSATGSRGPNSRRKAWRKRCEGSWDLCSRCRTRIPERKRLLTRLQVSGSARLKGWVGRRGCTRGMKNIGVRGLMELIRDKWRVGLI